MAKSSRDDQIDFLVRIKPFLIRDHYVTEPEIPVENESTVSFNDPKRVETLLRRIEKLERALVSGGHMPEEGFRKTKMKEKVMSVLQDRRKMTATEMSVELGLSRTRCSEYFKELMMEGRVEGVIVNRQKYYRPLRPQI